ncbi:MAG: TetR/AcrR family transcriptional regulator [Woeseiaceae bacterium]
MTPNLDARAERSQQALLQAGLELLNANPDASLSDIANHAGVGRTTLYRQYETREKLVSAIAVYCLETFDQVTDPIEQQATSIIDAVRLLFDLAMPLTQELQFLMSLDKSTGSDPVIVAIGEDYTKQMHELVEQGKKEGSIDKSLPTSWVANLIDGLFIVGWIQQQDGAYTSEKVAAFAFTSFCSGVSSP